MSRSKSVLVRMEPELHSLLLDEVDSTNRRYPGARITAPDIVRGLLWHRYGQPERGQRLFGPVLTRVIHTTSKEPSQ